jgi:hypothetical protein
LGQAESQKLRLETERTIIRSMTLTQRADHLHAPVPDYIVRSSQRTVHPAADAPSAQSSRSTPRENPRRMTEFINEKRQLFKLQLLIDGAQHRIGEIEASMQREESALAIYDSELDATAKSYKLQSCQLQSESVASAKAVQAAVAHRGESTRQLKLLVFSVAAMRSEIGNRQVLLQSRRLMHDFLIGITPPGQTFASPQDLLVEFEGIERENLRLGETVRDLRAILDRALATKVTDLAANGALTKCIQAQIEALSIVPTLAFQAPTSETQDRELARLADIVARTYRLCVRREPNISVFLQLGQIEGDLERKYRAIERVSPQFIAQRRAVHEKARRELQRTERQQKEAEDQKVKFAHAMERAGRAVSRGERRPLVRRTRPPKVETKNDARKERIRRERERIEQMLYGGVFEDHSA